MLGPASSAAGARVVGGSGGILPRKILKTRTSEMPFPAIWALTYENQFHWNKGHNLRKFNIYYCQKAR